MSFKVINESFVCDFCGEENPKAFRTCRNHCFSCLCAVHVDKIFPGDRKSDCKGKMVLAEVLPHVKHSFMLVHRCEICGKTIKNRAADDDNREKIFEIMQKKAEKQTQKKFFK